MLWRWHGLTAFTAGETDYVAARPAHLRLQARGPEAGLPLANVPAALELKEHYDDGTLAIVHACGLTHGTRSHFEA
ncbi:MAG: hypothetical protein F6K42_37810, partial [Leptolyngbya sp. SIO1D8]|nr:hypothetical protein [Leptolyngbya sp. SIO1D8]